MLGASAQIFVIAWVHLVSRFRFSSLFEIGVKTPWNTSLVAHAFLDSRSPRHTNMCSPLEALLFKLTIAWID